MGISMRISSSSYDEPQQTIVNYKNSTPDPTKYTVLRSKEKFGNLLVEIKYDTVSNYEGRKILFYKGTTLKELLNQKSIDPHFSDNKDMISPFARFEPTEAGWTLGLVTLFSLK